MPLRWLRGRQGFAVATAPSRTKAGCRLCARSRAGRGITGSGTTTSSYLPGNMWILNDTYPDGRGFQHPYLYHVASGRRVALGHFPAPPEYSGEWRCDTHPRFSPDGRSIVIDAPQPGGGRQLHLIDISRNVG